MWKHLASAPWTGGVLSKTPAQKRDTFILLLTCFSVTFAYCVMAGGPHVKLDLRLFSPEKGTNADRSILRGALSLQNDNLHISG